MSASRFKIVLKRAAQLMAAVVAGALSLTLIAAVALTQTQRGRARLVADLMPLIDAALPGKLAIESIAELGTSQIELRGVRVFDPEGNEVVSAQRVRVQLQLGPLLHGELLIRKAELVGVQVDLRDVAASGRGLVAAFVDLDAPPTPGPAQPLPHITLALVQMQQVSLRLPQVDALGPLALTHGAFVGRFELRDDQPHVDVTRASFSIVRGREPVGQIDRLTGQMPGLREPSSVALEATLFGTHVSLHARAALPGTPGADERKLSAELFLNPIDPATWLSQLGLSAELPAVRGPIAAHLVLDGTLRALAAQLALDTPGGALQLHATLDAYRQLAWRLAAHELQPERIVASVRLPQPGLVSARWSGTAELASGANAESHVSIEAETQLNRRQLPRISARARLSGSALRDGHLELSDAATRIVVDGVMQSERAGRADVTLRLDARTARSVLLALGEQAPDATGDISGRVMVSYDRRLSVRGTLASAQFETGPLRIAGLASRIQLTGELPMLVGTAALRLDELQYDGLSLRRVHFAAEGGPRKYTLQAAAEAPRFGALHAQLDLVQLSERVFRLAGHGSGSLWEQPWEARIAATRLDLSGRVQTERASLSIAGQQLQLEGRYEPDRVDIHVSAHAPALAKLEPLLQRASAGRLTLPNLRGAVVLDADLKGSLAQPRVRVHLDAQHAGALRYPSMDLNCDAALDATAGTSRIELRADSSERAPSERAEASAAQVGLRSHTLLESTFLRSADWLTPWLAGSHRVQLEVAQLDFEWLAALLDHPLPVRGSGSATLSAELSDTLHAAWQAKAKLDSIDGTDHLDVTHALDFADDQATTSLQADDAHGPLLKAAARTHLALRRAELAEWPSLLRSALERETWSLSLDVPTRDLRQLPRLGFTAREDWPAVKGGLSTTIDHLPHAEPRIALHVSAHQFEAWHKQSVCAFSGLDAVLDAKADAGRLSGQLTAVQDKRTLVDVDFSAQVELAPLLLGQPAKLEHSRTRAKIHDVELASLPLLCERARGKLQLTLELDEPLGVSPHATGSIAIQNFSLSHELVDVSGALQADAHTGTLDVRIGRAQGESRLHVAAPLQWSSRSFAFDRTRELVARLDLAALPIAPFVADRAGLSYASGTLDGKVALSGSFSKPHIAGEVGLHDIAFTVTNLAQPIDHINGTIRLAGNEIVIEKLSARDRDGTLKLSATAKLDSLKEGSGKAHLVLDEFPVRESGEIAAMVNGDLSIAAQLNADETRVRVDIEKLDTFLQNIAAANGLSLAPHPELRVDGVPNLAARPTVRARADGHSPTSHKTLIEVRSKERLWIKRGDFALRVNVALDIALEGLESRVTGKVMIERGFVDLFGQVFDVDPTGGSLEFSGSGVPDPVVSLKASHTNRRTGDVISVVISGLSSKPELKYTVNTKEVEPGAALAAIYGTTQNKQGTSTGDANSQAESMLRGLIAGVTASVARRNLGVGAPVLTLEAGDQDSGPRVSAGFEFDSLVPHVLRDVITGVYFEGSVGGDPTRTDASKGQSQGVNAGALLELHFPYNLFTSSQYGPGSTWALDFGWQL